MKNIWIWVAVAVVVVGAAGFYFMQGGGGLSTLGNTSLRSLIASNASQKCEFSNADSNGTIYVGAGKMRGDFASQAGGVEAQSHMVIANNIAYIWLDGSTQGYRMPFEKLSATSSAQSGGIDADAKVATKCENWQATEVSFALPTNVTFMEIGAQMQVPATTGASTGASAGANTAAPQTYAEQKCAACNMITDATAKAECKASFDCR